MTFKFEWNILIFDKVITLFVFLPFKRAQAMIWRGSPENEPMKSKLDLFQTPNLVRRCLIG